MNIEQFWKIIALSRRPAHARPTSAMERQRGELKRLLLQVPPDEIMEFRNHLFDRMAEAFKWDLWGAAYIIAGECSDDGFIDFRSWLISMGRRVFDDAMSDVESLIDPASSPEVDDVFFEQFMDVPAEAYKEATGREIPEYTGAIPEVPAGTKWDEHDENLQRRFPKLWAAFRQR